MNMKRKLWLIIGLFFMLILIYTFYINTPQYIVTNYWKHLSSGEFEKAGKLTSENIFDLNLSVYTPVERAFFKRTNLAHKKTQVDKDKAIVSGVMTLPDVAKALDSNQGLIDAIKKVPTIQKEYTFELQKTSEGWKIVSLFFGGD